MEWILIWMLLGIIGFVLRCFNKDTMPKKKFLVCIAFCTHVIFGLMGLAYGYFCFSGRKNKCQTL